MAPRLPTLRGPAVLFAHRGASAHEAENTLDAFTLALRLGATGLESDVWMTADGQPVLDHDGVVGRLRRRPISSLRHSELPEHIASLDELYDSCGAEMELSLDVGDPDVVTPVISAAAGRGAVERLWLCSPDLDLLTSWRSLAPGARLIWSTRLRTVSDGPERAAAELRRRDVDGINLHHSEWSGGLTTLFHRFGRLGLGWDAQHERIAAALIDMGIDGLYGDHVDRLVDAARES